MKQKQKQKQNKIRRFFSRVGEWCAFILTGKGPIGDECVNDGICDYSGQGRDEYGH